MSSIDYASMALFEMMSDEYESYKRRDLVYSGFFGVSMVVSFVNEDKIVGKKTTAQQNIVVEYLYGRFFPDLLALLPLALLVNHWWPGSPTEILNLLKLIRLELAVSEVKLSHWISYLCKAVGYFSKSNFYPQRKSPRVLKSCQTLWRMLVLSFIMGVLWLACC